MVGRPLLRSRNVETSLRDRGQPDDRVHHPLNTYLDLGNGNRFPYAGADPINDTDPTGYIFSSWDWVGLGGDIVEINYYFMNDQPASGSVTITGTTFGTFVGGASSSFATPIGGYAIGSLASDAMSIASYPYFSFLEDRDLLLGG